MTEQKQKCSSKSQVRWVFTYYGEVKDPSTMFNGVDRSKVREIGWQQERCPTTGRLHIQGYVCFTIGSKLTRKQAQETLFITGAHMEGMKGTVQDSRIYCSKLDTRVAGPWQLKTEKTGSKSGSKTEVCKKCKGLLVLIGDGKDVQGERCKCSWTCGAW